MINLFPKDEIFYALFEKQAEKLKEADQILGEILSNPRDLKRLGVEMKKLEEQADDIFHNLSDQLRKSFITPLEEEDINALRTGSENVMDCIEKAVNRMVLYQIKSPFPKEIKEYIEIIRKAIPQIEAGVKEIRNVRKNQDNLRRRCQKLNELENLGDAINRSALRNLMNVSSPTPEKILEIIKLKEIYETFENAIDFCENIGNIFEVIIIRNR